MTTPKFIEIELNGILHKATIEQETDRTIYFQVQTPLKIATPVEVKHDGKTFSVMHQTRFDHPSADQWIGVTVSKA